MAGDPKESSWCETLPGQPRVWDATRLATAQKCPRYFYYSAIRGLRRGVADAAAGAEWLNADPGADIHLEFGTHYHAAVEAFDRLLLEGVDRELALLTCFRELLTATWDAERNQPWGGELIETWQCTSAATVPGKRDPLKPVRNPDRCHWAKSPSAIMPTIVDQSGWSCSQCGLPAEHSSELVPFNKKKNRASLIRAFLLYADSPDAVELYKFPNGTPAVEVQVRVPLPLMSPDAWYECGDPGSERCDMAVGEQCPGCIYHAAPYELLANIDSMVIWEGELTIRERKTTGRALNRRYWDQFDPNTQVETYDLISFLVFADEDGQSPRILMEATEIGQTFCRLRRWPIRVSEGRRSEWFNQLQQLISEYEQRAQLATTAEDPESCYPMRRTACQDAIGSCRFIGVCRLASEAREEFIQGAFHVERWDPIAAASIIEEEVGDA